MTTEMIVVISAAVGAILSGGFVFFSLKNHRSPATIEAEVKKVIFMLFLYAEKQGWDGKKKMAYVAHKIYDFIPGQELSDILAGDHLLKYLESVYQEVKNRIK